MQNNNNDNSINALIDKLDDVTLKFDDIKSVSLEMQNYVNFIFDLRVFNYGHSKDLTVFSSGKQNGVQLQKKFNLKYLLKRLIHENSRGERLKGRERFDAVERQIGEYAKNYNEQYHINNKRICSIETTKNIKNIIANCEDKEIDNTMRNLSLLRIAVRAAEKTKNIRYSDNEKSDIDNAINELAVKKIRSIDFSKFNSHSSQEREKLELVLLNCVDPLNPKIPQNVMDEIVQKSQQLKQPNLEFLNKYIEENIEENTAMLLPAQQKINTMGMHNDKLEPQNKDIRFNDINMRNNKLIKQDIQFKGMQNFFKEQIDTGTNKITPLPCNNPSKQGVVSNNRR